MFISETIGYVYNLACVCIACIVRAREWVRLVTVRVTFQGFPCYK